MLRKHPRAIPLLAFAVLLLGPTAVRAAECPESSPEDAQERRKLAKEWFGTAESAENAGNDVEATRAYACSYKMVAHPYTAFNLGRVAERAGDNDLALKMYRAYLTLKPDATDRDDVKSKVKVLEDKIASTKEGGAASSDTADTGGAKPVEPPLDVVTPPPQPKQPVTIETTPEAEPEPSRSHAVEWIVGGASAAALVGGVVLNLSARSKMDSCRSNSKGGYLATALSDCDAAGPLAYTSYAMFGLAAAGAVVDTVLLLRGGRSSSSSTNDDTSVSWLWLPGGGGLAARGRF